MKNVVPQKTTSNPNPYTDAFYKKRQGWRSEYEAIADWIDANINGKTFGDVGCGNGFVIARLHQASKHVWGIDSAQNFSKVIDKKVLPFVTKGDLSHAQKLAKSDVALCLDVADRIAEKSADTVVKNLVSTAASTVLFTASLPGKAGIHHINLQPREYWLEKFGKHGYYLDVVLSHKFKTDLSKVVKNPVWYLDDMMIFRKYDHHELVRSQAVTRAAVEDLASEVQRLTAKNKKLEDELWLTGQRLGQILNSARWRLSSKLIRLIKQ